MRPIERRTPVGGDVISSKIASIERCLARVRDETAGGMLSDADAAEVISLLADGLHIKFSGTGHLIHAQQTEATLRHLQAFLESLPPLAARGNPHHTHNRNSRA